MGPRPGRCGHSERAPKAFLTHAQLDGPAIGHEDAQQTARHLAKRAPASGIGARGPLPQTLKPVAPSFTPAGTARGAHAQISLMPAIRPLLLETIEDRGARLAGAWRHTTIIFNLKKIPS